MDRGQYSKLRNRVIKLEHKLKDSLDRPGHKDAKRLQAEMHKLENMLQKHSNPRSIESEAKKLGQLFERYDNSDVMSTNDCVSFAGEMEDIIAQLRTFENY